MAKSNVSRRDMLKMSLVGAGALALGAVNADAAVSANTYNLTRSGTSSSSVADLRVLQRA